MEDVNKPKVFSLSAVTRRIEQIMAPVTSKVFWVKAEISSGSEKGGAFYCDLVEVDGEGNVIAKLRCSIWRHDLTRIKNKFKEQNVELELKNGTSAVFACNATYHAVYGFSLKVVDADPSFLLGELEMKRLAIIEGLKQDQLLDLNKDIIVPDIPMKIGLITSVGSAAYNDFVQTLTNSGFGFQIHVADAKVQGDHTESSVLRALESLYAHDCDVICLIRGGGSKTDLAYFDNDAIARAIALSPFPVWTGLGHEIDHPIAELVANVAFKTPTAVAEECVARCVNCDRYLNESMGRIKSLLTYRVSQAQDQATNQMKYLKQVTERYMDRYRLLLANMGKHTVSIVNHRISGCLIGLNADMNRFRGLCDRKIMAAKNQVDMNVWMFSKQKLLDRIEKERTWLTDKMSIIEANSPQRVLERGYVLLRGTNGKVVTSTKDTKPGDQLVGVLADGLVNLKVLNIDKSKGAKA